MDSAYLPAVIRAKYVSDFVLDIRFDDGTQKHVDVSQWFKGPMFKPLKNKTYFKKFFVESATIVWPNGADISPESLYEADDLRERCNKACMGPPCEVKRGRGEKK